MTPHRLVSLFLLLVFSHFTFAQSLRWLPETQVLIAEDGIYGRIIRLQSGHLLACYERYGQCCIKRSLDDGKIWQEEKVVTNYAYGKASNPELLQLKTGKILLSYNERPDHPGHPYTISYLESKDGGNSWGEVKRLFTDPIQEDGCWEPSMIQFPDGGVQFYFANEAPYRTTKEQEISMISIGQPEEVHRVSFRPQARDGMPVPCLLNDGKTIIMAIEDSGFDGKMKPMLLSSPVNLRWRQGFIPAESPRRWNPLKSPLPTEVYAGAPYIVQFPNGTTVLSVQTDEDSRAYQMKVYLGDDKAQNFHQKSTPFQLKHRTASLWNSLFIKDDDTITAISTTRINGKEGLWAIDGKLSLPKN